MEQKSRYRQLLRKKKKISTRLAVVCVYNCITTFGANHGDKNQMVDSTLNDGHSEWVQHCMYQTDLYTWDQGKCENLGLS